LAYSTKPKVSVVIPTYNRDSFLPRCLNSVLMQGFPDIEVIVVDDGSTDDTQKVLAGYGNRIVAVRQAHAGLAVARTRGITMAKSDLVAFVDSDDKMLLSRLQRQFEFMQAHPDVAAVSGNIVIEGMEDVDYLAMRGVGFAGEDFVIFENAFQRLLRGDFMADPSAMIRRDKFFEIGGYSIDGILLQSSNDWDLWLRMSRKWKLACLNWPCTWVGRHGGNISSSPGQFESNLEVVEKALKTEENINSDLLKEVLQRQYRYLKSYMVNYLYGRGTANSEWIKKIVVYSRRLTRTQRLILFLAARLGPLTRAVISIRRFCCGGKTESPKRFKVAIIGIWNWLDVAGELFRRAGIDCQVLNLHSRKDYFWWIIKGGWREFDVIHHVWGNERLPGLVFKTLGIPVVWHWIGSDVLNFRKIWRGGGGLRGMVNRRIAFNWSRQHLADSPGLASELAELGITASVVRLLPKAVEATIEPLPSKPAVLSYWSPISRDKYQSSVVMQLAASMPDLQFLIVGDNGDGIPPLANVKFLGFLPNLSEVYPQISIYIRLIEHDSLSAIVLEALARGRYVIYSKPFPHAEMATTFDQARAALVRLVEQTRPNEEGAAYVKSHYSLQEQVNFLKRWYAQEFGVSAGPVLD